MNNKNIIIAGAIAVGLYLFSQTKTTAQKIWPTAPSTIRQRTAQKIAQKIAQKVAPKRIGQPTTEAARIAALLRATAQKENIFELPVQLLRYLIAHAAAQKKTGKEVVALKAEVARREAAYIAAKRKAAVRKAAAQKIGKKIGKTVAQKVAQKKVASWKAPYRSPNSQFRVITPSNLLKKLAKKDIARKKAPQQKKVQKTTPSTPSDRRKSRLKALYGSHWHDIWTKRQKRR